MSRSDKDKKRKKRIIILIVIIILIIDLILAFVKIDVPEEKIFLTDVPYFISEEKTAEREYATNVCTVVSYEWDYDWEGWQVDDDYVTPYFRLTNLDTEPGVFSVHFAFFEEDEHQYDEYEGKVYDTIKHKLPWSAAIMYSPKLSYAIQPNENRVITVPTRKVNPEATYWAYADVTVPNKTVCSDYPVEKTITFTQNETKYRQEFVTSVSWRRMSLWQWLIEKIFG